MIKKYCIDCEKLLNKDACYCGTKRCNSCSAKLNLKGKKHSQQHIENIRSSMIALDRTGSNNPMFGKKPGCTKRSIYKNIYFRSSWEVAYAKYLDRNRIKWEYESKIFNLGQMCYIPDFYLLETNEYVEIKGRWIGRARNKFDLFKLKNSQIKITLLEERQLKKLKII